MVRFNISRLRTKFLFDPLNLFNTIVNRFCLAQHINDRLSRKIIQVGEIMCVCVCVCVFFNFILFFYIISYLKACRYQSILSLQIRVGFCLFLYFYSLSLSTEIEGELLLLFPTLEWLHDFLRDWRRNLL